MYTNAMHSYIRN